MRVKELMQPSVEWCAPETSVVELARMMRDDDIGAIPIADEDRLIGMVTDRDITLRATAEARDAQTCTAKDVMTDSIDYCFEDAGIEEAANIMKSHLVRRLPVINQDKRLVGMITVGDITGASPELAGETLKALSAIGS